MTQQSRREFIATTTTAAIAGSVLLQSSIPRSVHAGGSDTLRVGLVGCGGRGSSAASQALQADPNVKLVALGDAFADRVQSCLASLQKIDGITNKIDVTPERCFAGFNA